MSTTQKIFFGDSRNMTKVGGGSVQLIVTSPPYWWLKDYGEGEQQIGYYDTYEEYINNLNLVWQECYRVLSDGCRLCINVADITTATSDFGRSKTMPIHSDIIQGCEALGFDYMNTIIWQKAANHHAEGGSSHVMGSYPYPRNGIVITDYEYIMIFKKPGEAPKPSIEQKENSKISKEEWTTYFYSPWTFTGVKQGVHPAMYPYELPRRLIKMFSFEGDTVLDPFLGSGTTSQAAMDLNRNSIGYELNKDFKGVIQSKVNPGLFIDAKVSFENDDSEYNIDYTKLPFVYKDPHNMGKLPSSEVKKDKQS